MSRTRLLMMLSVAIPLAACGADDISSPGGGGNIIINNPAPSPSPSPSPSPTPSPTVTPAAGCPTIADPQGLTDSGTIANPTAGTFRVCTLPSRINTSITLPKVAGLVYRLGGRVDVGTDLGPTPGAKETAVTLTIDPGVVVFGGTGVSWLNVNRGHRISAIGTATQPIVFTSRDNMLGLNTESSSGQWGGVVLSGRAQITDCAAPNAAPGTVACERQTEGAQDPALYGGATNTDNSGTISFAQIRFSGFVLSGNSELQSLTTQGIGRGTKLDHIQSFNSSDDGAEFFGGRVNMKYFITVGAEDDNLDTDTGVKANFQYVLVVQRPDVGDSVIEADSDNANDANLPRQNTIISNMTAIHRVSTSNNTAILLRGGTDYTIANSIMVAPKTSCLTISRTNTTQAADPAQDEAGPPVFRSVLFQCGSPAFKGANGVTEAQVSAIFGSGANNNNSAYTPTLASLFVNGATEAAVPAFDVTGLNADPEVKGGFFNAVTYVGAFKDANDQWFKGWVCNSAIADFGLANTTGLCTAIPTT